MLDDFVQMLDGLSHSWKCGSFVQMLDGLLQEEEARWFRPDARWSPPGFVQMLDGLSHSWKNHYLKITLCIMIVNNS